MALHEFLSEYYELFAELETNKAQFSEEFYAAARKLLLNQFEQATSTWLDEQELAFAETRFELKFKVANYTPRRHMFFWWNKTAKSLLRRYRADLERYLAEISKAPSAQSDLHAEFLQQDNLPACRGESAVAASNSDKTV